MNRFILFVLAAIGCGNDINLVPVSEETSETQVSQQPNTSTMSDPTVPAEDTGTTTPSVEVEDTGVAPVVDDTDEEEIVEDTGTEPVEDTDVPVEEIEDTGGEIIEEDPCDELERRLFDLDGDGFGNPNDYLLVSVCDAWIEGLVQWIVGNDDCDDNNASIHPGADEVCDDVDNDCDNSIDEEAVDATIWYFDNDGDGYGFSSIYADTWSCNGSTTPPGPGYVLNADDCYDSGPQAERTYPGIAWLEADPSGCMNDHDLDGYGDDGHYGDLPSAVIRGTDCNDGWFWNHPNTTEHDCADTSDNDCDGLIDSQDPECF